MTLRYWTSDKDWFGTKLDLTKLAKTSFDARGISIPVPQQEIVYRAGDPPIAAPAARPAAESERTSA